MSRPGPVVSATGVATSRDRRRPVRFGLVGCGAISTQHVEAIRAVDGAELVAVASASEARARSGGERWGVPWTTDLASLLARDDVDAVAICTPSGLHAAEALAALRRGKHVVVEKPLSLTVVDAEAVIAEAARTGRVVATISQRRFEPVTRALRDSVAAGAFGHIALVIAEGIYHRPQSYYDSAAWRGTRAMDGGVLMNQAIHMVDLLRWIGGPVVSVAAHVSTLGHEMEAEDAATVSLRFANGALGSIVATTAAEPGFAQELRVYGDRGHARLVGDVAAEWVTADGTPNPGEVARGFADLASAVTPDQHAPATWGTDATGHIRQYADIVEAIRDGRPPAITGEDGRDAVEIVTAAYESDRLGRAIAIGPMRAARGAPR